MHIYISVGWFTKHAHPIFPLIINLFRYLRTIFSVNFFFQLRDPKFEKVFSELLKYIM